MKDVQKISLMAQPPATATCFALLRESGAVNFALFGGAIRDADYAATYNEARPVKDYDLRVWFSDTDHDAQVIGFITKLNDLTGGAVVETPSLGTNRIRYCLTINGIELDISVRPVPQGCVHPTPAAVAIDRAGDSDIGICSAAIDADGQAWGTEAYVADMAYKTLTLYPNPDRDRAATYLTRMMGKFPQHRVIDLNRPPVLRAPARRPAP